MCGLSAVWRGSGFDFVEAAPQPLPEGWARLRVEACGICGSDLHAWREPSLYPTGVVGGHEFAGTIVDGPAGLADRLYAVSPHVVCGHCEFCVAGSSNLCGGSGNDDGFIFMGLNRPGGFAEIVNAPVGNFYPVDGSVSPLVASLAEPLAVCVRAARLAAEPGSRVLITGAGTLGLLSVLLARDRVSEIGVTARYPHQRALVEQLGATALGEDDWQEWTGERRPDVVIETAGGSGDALKVGVQAARPGGRLVIVGLMGSVAVDIGHVTMSELSIVGSFIYGAGQGGEFAAAVDLLPRWQPELALLQSHQFKLESIEEAFRCASDKSTGAVKVSITR
jgi:threonine dehydrogenase-like Zn-dependent dehydrogenase